MNHTFDYLKTFIPGMNARIGYELERRNWSKQEIVTFKSSFPLNEAMSSVEIGEKCRGVVDDIMEQVNDERSRRLSISCRGVKVYTESDEKLFTLTALIEFTDPLGA